MSYIILTVIKKQSGEKHLQVKVGCENNPNIFMRGINRKNESISPRVLRRVEKIGL